MNTNDLPPAAKLAALIEAGRAANPDLGHGTVHLLYQGKACALGFAALAAGASRDALETRNVYDNSPHWKEVNRVLPAELQDLGYWRVWRMNDKGATLDEICRSLREGELAQALI